MAPASREPGGADRQRWWRLHRQRLEVLAGGAWRVIATLTTHQPLGPVEPRLAVDPSTAAAVTGWRWGRGVLDRRAFATGERAWSFGPMARLELAVRAGRKAPG